MSKPSMRRWTSQLQGFAEPAIFSDCHGASALLALLRYLTTVKNTGTGPNADCVLYIGALYCLASVISLIG